MLYAPRNMNIPRFIIVTITKAHHACTNQGINRTNLRDPKSYIRLDQIANSI